MDVYRKELTRLYASQELGSEALDGNVIEECNRLAEGISAVSGACCIVTDAAEDYCYLHAGSLGTLIGISDTLSDYKELDSSDEDLIYTRLHPEDLVEKRMLEYEFFKYVDHMTADEKVRYKATCRIRIKDRNGDYVFIDNSTQVLRPSPAGRIWLILCCYDLAPRQNRIDGISPRIINNHTGEIVSVSFSERKRRILTDREKEILMLIKEGKASKQIAYLLDISVYTVNRHRQNILEKLSVGNSIEAIAAADSMKLI